MKGAQGPVQTAIQNALTKEMVDGGIPLSKVVQASKDGPFPGPSSFCLFVLSFSFKKILLEYS